MSRAAFAEILTGGVLLIAVAISAYHVYRHPLQLREWLSATKGSADEYPGGTPIHSAPETVGVSAFSSVPPPDLGTGRVAISRSDAPAPPLNEPTTNVTPSPGRQGGFPATGANGASGQTPAPDAAPLAAQARDKTTPPAGNLGAPMDATANRSSKTRVATAPAADVHSPPRDGRAIIPAHVTRPGACTEAGAPLGGCSSKKTSTTAKTTAKKAKKTPTKKVTSTQARPVSKTSTTTAETAKTVPPE